MGEFHTLTDDGERFTCQMPAQESVVEVKLKSGAVKRAFCAYADGYDFVPVDERDEPTDGDSIFDDVAAWRYPEPAAGGIAGKTLRAANAERQREWHGDAQPSLSFRGCELAGEVGEACNIIKKLEREKLGAPGSRASVEDLAAELADVIICADLIAMQAGIDLEAAVRDKFNATSEKYGLKTRLVTLP